MFPLDRVVRVNADMRKRSDLPVHELPVPKVGAGGVLIRVHTAGVGTWAASDRSPQMPEYIAVPASKGGMKPWREGTC